ncbi:MAG: fumarylacetoacetate hydrolase family protein [Alphaproteobacteria bacterium]|nr:MAG: fumarylacetoacetate hydrolase family protein [Alphaproteobacteria bacterium]
MADCIWASSRARRSSICKASTTPSRATSGRFCGKATATSQTCETASSARGLPPGVRSMGSRPGKVICLGLNYLEHVKEGSQRDNIPRFPTIFMRGNSSLVPHGQPILRPKASETLDYEAELIFIVGKRAKHLSVDNAYTCVAGYACGNEGSVREYQRKTTQWDMGKNFDRTGGFGPWMVTADELPPGAKGLNIQSRLNGEVMQSDNTSNMMFPIAQTIAYITQGLTLEPGDIVFTGTPSGVGHARKPNPVWMKPGDTCEIDIEGVGVLVNPIAAE